MTFHELFNGENRRSPRWITEQLDEPQVTGTYHKRMQAAVQAQCNAQRTHDECNCDAESSPSLCAGQEEGVGAPLKIEGREGVEGAPLTNPSHPNFSLFWTQAAIYFGTRRCTTKVGSFRT